MHIREIPSATEAFAIKQSKSQTHAHTAAAEQRISNTHTNTSPASQNLAVVTPTHTLSSLLSAHTLCDTRTHAHSHAKHY